MQFKYLAIPPLVDHSDNLMVHLSQEMMAHFSTEPHHQHTLLNHANAELLRMLPPSMHPLVSPLLQRLASPTPTADTTCLYEYWVDQCVRYRPEVYRSTDTTHFKQWVCLFVNDILSRTWHRHLNDFHDHRLTPSSDTNIPLVCAAFLYVDKHHLLRQASRQQFGLLVLATAMARSDTITISQKCSDLRECVDRYHTKIVELEGALKKGITITHIGALFPYAGIYRMTQFLDPTTRPMAKILGGIVAGTMLLLTQYDTNSDSFLAFIQHGLLMYLKGALLINSLVQLSRYESRKSLLSFLSLVVLVLPQLVDRMPFDDMSNDAVSQPRVAPHYMIQSWMITHAAPFLLAMGADYLAKAGQHLGIHRHIFYEKMPALEMLVGLSMSALVGGVYPETLAFMSLYLGWLCLSRDIMVLCLPPSRVRYVMSFASMLFGPALLRMAWQAVNAASFIPRLWMPDSPTDNDVLERPFSEMCQQRPQWCRRAAARVLNLPVELSHDSTAVHRAFRYLARANWVQEDTEMMVTLGQAKDHLNSLNRHDDHRSWIDAEPMDIWRNGLIILVCLSMVTLFLHRFSFE